jgi:trimeric autotransporter adhesin
MSVSGISAYSNWWQWQSQATTGSNATSTSTSSASDSITNGGSLAASGSVSSFMQAFSADLQAMLTQLGSDTSSATASATSDSSSATTSATSDTSTTSSVTDQTASSQASGTVHHHHHPHGSDNDGSMGSTANQLVDEIGQAVQSGSLSSDQITQSASVFASDVMQALQSYGTTATTAAATSILA